MIFRTALFPEQYLVTAADDFKIVVKTKNVWDVIQDLFSCSDSPVFVPKSKWLRLSWCQLCCV